MQKLRKFYALAAIVLRIRKISNLVNFSGGAAELVCVAQVCLEQTGLKCLI
jgi:hypothetical protein